MLNVRNLCAVRGGREVLCGIDFSLRPHAFTAVLGRNGCGKSTLISCINQEIPYTGTISFGDRDLAMMLPRERARTLAVLPQTLAAPSVSVKELASFGRSPYLDLGRRFTEEDRKAMEDALQTAGAAEMSDRRVDRLSGGERQKAYFAMILAQNTRILALDEPTAYMDLSHETEFLTCLSELKTRRKKTLLVVMHDLAQAVEYADDILLLDQKKLFFSGSAEECLAVGAIEAVFGVKRYETWEGGRKVIFFSARRA